MSLTIQRTWRRSTKSAAVAVRLAFLAIPSLLMAYPTSPPTQLTGAPGEGTCSGCHSSMGTGTVKLVVQGTSSAPTTWAAGVVQHLTAIISETGKQAWGYELSPRTASNGQAGTLTATDANSSVQTTSGLQYIYQVNPQTSVANSASFNFDWTPPATGTGNVTLYLAGVAGKSGSNDATYTASYTLTSGSPPPVSITISALPNALTFAATAGGSAPAAQTFQVTSSGAAQTFTTSLATTTGGSWLSATPAGTSTPQNVSVSVNPTGLAAGTYKGSVTVAASGASNSPQTVAITLNVQSPSAKPSLTAAPTSLTFSSSGSAAVPSQNLALNSSGAALSFTAASSTTSGGSWLSASLPGGTTPASLVVSVNAAGLASGTYMGQITLMASAAGNSPVNVPVTLTVGSSTPPPPTTGTTAFSFVALDSESGGPHEAIITGAGVVKGSSATGAGRFEVFTPGMLPFALDMSGTWKTTGVVAHMQVASDAQAASTAAVLELNVELLPTGGDPIAAVLTISGTGQDAGVTLTIPNGASYVPSGVAEITIGSKQSGSGGDDSGGGGKSGGNGNGGGGNGNSEGNGNGGSRGD